MRTPPTWLVVLVACAGPTPQPPSTTSPTSPTLIVVPVPATSDRVVAVKPQPASTKLHLGHYHDNVSGIGVTIDLTEKTDNVADIGPAKLRFDGESKVWRLAGQNGPFGRIDYVRTGGKIVLQLWSDGHRAIYVPDPETDRSSNRIYIYRDSDADPL